MCCCKLCVRKGLYIHVVLSDNRFGVGLGPLAELVVSLGEAGQVGCHVAAWCHVKLLD